MPRPPDQLPVHLQWKQASLDGRGRRLHLALSSNLEDAASIFRTNFGDYATAGFLSRLAGDHKKDAFMLRALLWEDKPQ